MPMGEHAGRPPTAGGELTANPGSSARQTHGKGIPEGLLKGFQDPYGFRSPLPVKCNHRRLGIYRQI